MNIHRIAAFSDGNKGGNPAGVVIDSTHPSQEEMQSIAAKVGYSETAFAMPEIATAENSIGNTELNSATPENNSWRVRYFSPESEVPFCGHATIALGAALAKAHGNGTYNLVLNNAKITVEGQSQGQSISAALQSPPTYSNPAEATLENAALSLFGIQQDQLDNRAPIGFAHAGANHLVIMLNSREALAAMTYDLDEGRKMMIESDLITVLLGYAETPQLIHTRNPFASGGVYEDPATGAATAALAGYLRDIQWPHGGKLNIIQGEDMGSRSLLSATFSDEIGSSIRVAGTARFMQ